MNGGALVSSLETWKRSDVSLSAAQDSPGLRYLLLPMLLFSLPHAIWREVLINWLGNLGNIVRFDSALRLMVTESPLRAVYADSSFIFSSNKIKESGHPLPAGLSSWMRVAKVFINQLTLYVSNGVPSPQWEDLIALSGEHLQTLTLIADADTRNSTDQFFAWAACYLKRLRHFRLTSAPNESLSAIAKLLRNNSNTLVSVIMDLLYDGESFKQELGTAYPCLQVFQCISMDEPSLCDLLSRCPKLTDLFICDGDNSHGSFLMQTLARCCPLLRKLCLDNFYRLDMAAFQQMARDCHQIQYLHVRECRDIDAALLTDMVNQLPNLHTLVGRAISESALLELTARERPTLHVIDTYTRYTFNGLRQITAALPQLTGLAIHALDLCATGVDWSQLLEHCLSLENLKINLRDASVWLVNSLLESAATFCPNLRCLIIETDTPFYGDVLSTVLERLPRLVKLRTSLRRACTYIVPISNTELDVSYDFMEIAPWMPV